MKKGIMQKNKNKNSPTVYKTKRIKCKCLSIWNVFNKINKVKVIINKSNYEQ